MLRLPTNRYSDEVCERDISLAIYEELRALRRTFQFLVFLATPVVLLGMIRLFDG